MSTISEKLAQTVAQKERIVNEVNTQTDLISQIKSALENNVSENIYNDGYDAGYKKGLQEREYETWTITLTDGSTIEKEVALL